MYLSRGRVGLLLGKLPCQRYWWRDEGCCHLHCFYGPQEVRGGIGEKFNISVRKSERNRPLGRHRHRWGGNIKMNPKV